MRKISKVERITASCPCCGYDGRLKIKREKKPLCFFRSIDCNYQKIREDGDCENCPSRISHRIYNRVIKRKRFRKINYMDWKNYTSDQIFKYWYKEREAK